MEKPETETETFERNRGFPYVLNEADLEMYEIPGHKGVGKKDLERYTNSLRRWEDTNKNLKGIEGVDESNELEKLGYEIINAPKEIYKLSC